LSKTNNFSHNKRMAIVDSTLFPDKGFIISNIQRVLRYSFDRHVITKLENHERKEITPDELVEQYYKDPDQYFDFDSKGKPEGEDPTTSTSTDTTTTTIQEESKSSDDQHKSPLRI
jgi:hypothetical protein